MGSLYLRLASVHILRRASIELPSAEYDQFVRVVRAGVSGVVSTSHAGYVLEMIAERRSSTLAADVRCYFDYLDRSTRIAAMQWGPRASSRKRSLSEVA